MQISTVTDSSSESEAEWKDHLSQIINRCKTTLPATCPHIEFTSSDPMSNFFHREYQSAKRILAESLECLGQLDLVCKSGAPLSDELGDVKKDLIRGICNAWHFLKMFLIIVA
jgi:hypothetical protein